MTHESKPLGESRLMEIIEAYGADPARWPAEAQDAAAAIARQAPETKSAVTLALAEARRLDALLAHAPSGQVREGLLHAVLASAPPPDVAKGGSSVHGAKTGAPGWLRFWAPRGLGFGSAAQPVAAMLLAGLIGLGIGLMTDGVTAEEETVSLLSQPYGGFDALESYSLEGNP